MKQTELTPLTPEKAEALASASFERSELERGHKTEAGNNIPYGDIILPSHPLNRSEWQEFFKQNQIQIKP